MALVLSLIIIPTNTNKVNAGQILEGVALKSPTKVYSSTSRSSELLKDYNKGSILLYLPHSGEWYGAVVFINGKRHNGFINKSDVDTSVKDQQVLKGIGTKSPTSVYSEASTSSNKLKSYGQGSRLLYTTYTSNWYEAVVFVNGDRKIGYIHKSHVANIVENQQLLRGLGLKSPTPIYAKASTDSKQIKSYPSGSILLYKTFTGNWYEALVYVNGNRTTGYINVNHTEGLYEEQKLIKGYAKASPTNVYLRASKSSSVLKNYSKDSSLLYKSFSPNWYEALVYVNGQAKTGYIHIDDVTQEKPEPQPEPEPDDVYDETNYDSDFYEVVDTQMSKAPQVWYDGGFIDASEQQVAYYVNSSNFHKEDTSFFQFLDLSEPAGVHAGEINQNVLNGKGILSGKAQAFIDGANKHNINEIYLMSHALHETGNGHSELAIGVPVDAKGNIVAASKAKFTVYNMYGIGAYDDCALSCGAKHAFEQGWFTPEEAIIGGAAFIGKKYINVGQNTLYKMRWSPDAPGQHQYATDVAWAVSQTTRISNIYNLIEDYVLVFDIPKYEDQPSSSGDPNVMDTYPKGTYGITESGNIPLNIRNVPDGKDIGNIPNGSKIEILATNGTWYKVSYNGITGWSHGAYIELLNLIEVTLDGYSLNVRTGPSTNNNRIGEVNLGDQLAVVLDSSNNMVRQDQWYQVIFEGEKAWLSGGANGTEYVKSIK